MQCNPTKGYLFWKCAAWEIHKEELRGDDLCNFNNNYHFGSPEANTGPTVQSGTCVAPQFYLGLLRLPEHTPAVSAQAGVRL